MKVITDIDAARRAVRELQFAGKTVGLVPTMGALHAGHLSLIQAARRDCNATAVTIFVNPIQFGPSEDFGAYPRTIETDIAACEANGVEIVFAPAVEAMYPGDELTHVHVRRITEVLCGPRRPGHFTGVATVVLKLFHILPADKAYFGEKDYQQLAVIRAMARDLNVPIEIVGYPTLREPDGLAMSSRNAYLSPAQRQQAVSLNRGLFAAVERVGDGERDVRRITDRIREQILAAGPADIEYVDVVDATTLELLREVDRPARICLAVRIGSCRLIDNVGVDV